jgi:hypothetical protein
MYESDEPLGYIDRVAAWFGVGELDFRLSRADRRRIFLASIIPLVIFGCELTDFLLRFFSLVSSDGFLDGLTAWDRLDNFVTSIDQVLLPLAITSIFLYGIFPVSRRQGSAAFLITIVLLNVAFLLGLYVTLLTTFHRTNTLYDDWYLYDARTISYYCGALSLGYAFLAYRGLRPRLPVSRRRVRVRD